MTNQNTTSAPDVGAILEALRADVRAQRSARGQAEASQIARAVQRSLDEIELNRVVSAHWPLQGRTLPQRAVALINKLVRRGLRWYINPIVEQQNAYNDTVARCLRLLAEAYSDLAEPMGEEETRRHGDTESQSNASAGSRFSVLGSSDKQSAICNLQSAIEPPARFPDLELQAAMAQLALREQVLAHWPLPAATLPQRAVALINKLVRRGLRWYINPIVEQQNAANAAFTVALVQLVRLDAERRADDARRRAARHRS